MPVRGGNKGMLSEKQRILRVSAEEAPVDVPPEVEVGLRNGGVESSKVVESFGEAPSEGAGSSWVDIKEAPPVSSIVESVEESLQYCLKIISIVSVKQYS